MSVIFQSAKYRSAKCPGVNRNKILQRDLMIAQIWNNYNIRSECFQNTHYLPICTCLCIRVCPCAKKTIFALHNYAVLCCTLAPLALTLAISKWHKGDELSRNTALATNVNLLLLLLLLLLLIGSSKAKRLLTTAIKGAHIPRVACHVTLTQRRLASSWRVILAPISSGHESNL